MPLSPAQRQHLEEWMRSKAIVQCPACGDNRWRLDDAAYVRALLEEGEPDLTESGGVVKISCGKCGYVALFDAETVGIRGSWAQGRDL
jgi:predicted nucleic-acid-binding Zn-ribbon protein